jgi:LEA14-like dessication related protein
MTLQGRVIASYKVPGSNVTAIPVGRMESGVYFVKIVSGKGNVLQMLRVTD